MNYLEIIKNVLANGQQKQATRLDNAGNIIPVENGTIGTFCEIFRHNMADGFPLTTLRKMPWRSIRVELEGFIKGITDKSWYQERKCKFWDEWCNPRQLLLNMPIGGPLEEQIQIRKEAQARINDLGPIYGYQWRQFGKDFYDGINMIDCVIFEGYSKGYDQLKSIVDKLKSNPYDRRMVCSAWNPNQMDMMALPPCHWGWNVVVYGNKLNLIWHQRSCDLLLGVGANIASYALLLELLAKEANLVPGELVGTLADCHIYKNHLEAAKELVTREENKLPTLVLDNQSIFDFSADQATLLGYNPYDKIDVGAVTV